MTVDILVPEPVPGVVWPRTFLTWSMRTDIIVVNKPKGMVVHPSREREGTLVNALLHCGDSLSDINGVSSRV